MHHFKAVIAYDGTDFHGWQLQEGHRTVASVLNQTFKTVFFQEINILGASRTDAGVHAAGQVTHFSAPLSLPPEKMRHAWNCRLPSGIYVRSIEQVPGYFNPCQNVARKVYQYHIFRGKPLPFIARFGWICKFIEYVDLAKFEAALQYYQGTHDFRSFCKMDRDDERSTVRTVDRIMLERVDRFKALRVTIVGKSFLHFQIRRMIGYALDVARRHNLPAHTIKQLLDAPDAQQNLVKADAQGLVLRKIIYERHEFKP